ncbi:alpha/beta hydrolase [Amycolatopsis ultiminotia]|uniref:Alpha/beta hydrolase n=1 Tax=Amycolatopsis ultiminotia TaxID=543629 RepID=A0ABP6XSB9_9PSEU
MAFGPALDRDTLDREYSPSSRIPDIGVYLDEYAVRSRQVRAYFPRRHCLRYGPRPEQLLDYFPPTGEGAPLHVYIHGGYWQQLDKNDSHFPAPGFLRAGAGFAALGYGLAPRYSLDEIVTMVREGLLWLLRTAGRLPGRPGAIHLSGSSAGAHLIAMALLTGWLPDGLHPADVFTSATLLSGVYLLDPLRGTYINDAVGLDAEAADRNSPIALLPERLPPLVVARGDNETDAFAWQHDEFVAAARPRAASLTDFVARERNHFDLPLDLSTPGTQLGDAVLGRTVGAQPSPVRTKSLPAS